MYETDCLEEPHIMAREKTPEVENRSRKRGRVSKEKKTERKRRLLKMRKKSPSTSRAGKCDHK